MEYIDIARQLFDWLSGLQVQTDPVGKKNNKSEYRLRYRHPTLGKREAIIPYPIPSQFQIEGIGFQKLPQSKQVLCYDDGGIYDPITHCVVGEQYATTHFALLGAILYNETQDEQIFDRIYRAIQFHLRTAPDEYLFRSDQYYHWDFQNYALIETYRLLEKCNGHLDTTRWEDGIRSWKTNKDSPLSNWIAMRAYASILRYSLFFKKRDFLDSEYMLWCLDWARDDDGYFHDHVYQSKPIQYHVFALAILHRIFLNKPRKYLLKRFLKGVHLFLQFIDPEGCFNYLGRGQEQIFGYAAGIYVLEAARLHDPDNAGQYADYATRLWNYLLQFRVGQHFPLVLNHSPDSQKYGWYSYNHLTVYNAFLGAWLGMTHALKRDGETTLRCVGTGHVQQKSFQFVANTQIAFINKPLYFIVLNSGKSIYLSEPVVSPVHFWVSGIGFVFTCPGGADPKRYGNHPGDRFSHFNYFAPLSRSGDGSWRFPVSHDTKKMMVCENGLKVHFDYQDFELERLYRFGEDEICIQDRYFPRHRKPINELRIFNLPVYVDKFQVLIEPDQIVLVAESHTVFFRIVQSDFMKIPFEEVEEIRTVKGPAQIYAMCLKAWRFQRRSPYSFTLQIKMAKSRDRHS